jgi:hypothetical protein
MAHVGLEWSNGMAYDDTSHTDVAKRGGYWLGVDRGGCQSSKGLFVLLSIHVDWVGLSGFQSRTSPNLSYFFPIPSNPHAIGITEQALMGWIMISWPYWMVISWPNA